MNAVVEEENVMLLRDGYGNALARAYRAVCRYCEPHWRGEPHVIGQESAPNAAALDDADDHDREFHA